MILASFNFPLIHGSKIVSVIVTFVVETRARAGAYLLLLAGLTVATSMVRG